MATVDCDSFMENITTFCADAVFGLMQVERGVFLTMETILI